MAPAKKDWIEAISKASKVEKASVRKVINAMVETLRDDVAKEERVAFPRLGTFVRRAGKKPGESRVVFRPWTAKEGAEKKGEKKAEKKA